MEKSSLWLWFWRLVFWFCFLRWDINLWWIQLNGKFFCRRCFSRSWFLLLGRSRRREKRRRGTIKNQWWFSLHFVLLRVYLLFSICNKQRGDRLFLLNNSHRFCSLLLHRFQQHLLLSLKFLFDGKQIMSNLLFSSSEVVSYTFLIQTRWLKGEQLAQKEQDHTLSIFHISLYFFILFIILYPLVVR